MVITLREHEFRISESKGLIFRQKKDKLRLMKKSLTTQKALNLWAVILIIWSFYRAKLNLPEWFDELVAKPIVFVLPVIYYIIRIEKSNVFQALWWKKIPPARDIFIGLGIGILFPLTIALSVIVSKHKLVFFPGKTVSFDSIVIALLIVLATSVTEEILSRGFVLKRLYNESKNFFTSSLFASFLFFFLHVPILFTNSHLTGNAIIFIMATDLLLSLVSSFVFLERKSLITAILIHAFYNLSFYLFI